MYKVYFEIFGKKMVKEVEADTPYAAILKIENEKFIIHKTEFIKSPPKQKTNDFFNDLWNMANGGS